MKKSTILVAIATVLMSLVGVLRAAQQPSQAPAACCDGSTCCNDGACCDGGPCCDGGACCDGGSCCAAQ